MGATCALRRPGRVVEGGRDRRGQLFGVPGPDQADQVVVANGILQDGEVAGHDRRLHRHGLDQDIAQPLPARGDGDHVGGAEQVGDVVARAEERHPSVQAEPGRGGQQ